MKLELTTARNTFNQSIINLHFDYFMKIAPYI